MANTISRTFIGTNATITVVNKETMTIEDITVYVDGAFTVGKELDKAIRKEIDDSYYTYVSTVSAEPCNKTLEMSVSDFMRYAKPIETREVKGYRERPLKNTTDKKDNKKK